MNYIHATRAIATSVLFSWRCSILMILFHIPTRLCISCYHCSVTNLKQKDDCLLRYKTQATICQDAFCLKTEMSFLNGTLKSFDRTCSPMEVRSGCTSGHTVSDNPSLSGDFSMKISDKSQTVKVCTHFCSSDLCNASSRVFPSWFGACSAALFFVSIFFRINV